MRFEVMLGGLKNFDGRVPATGCNLSWIDGDHRKGAVAALVHFVNYYTRGLRTEFGRWQEVLPLEIFVEDLLQATNFVTDEGHDFSQRASSRAIGLWSKGPRASPKQIARIAGCVAGRID